VRRRRLLEGAGALVFARMARADGAERFITVASTTSTEQSGLFRHLLPIFRQKTGIAVRVVAVGTGQAVRLAEKGDADVLFVHHRPSEEKFVAEGWSARRYPVMYNDFVVVAAVSGRWYRETGSGMGATLNTAAGLDAYALTDRGTWLGFANRRHLAIAVEGDPRLFNQYGAMVVARTRHPHVKEPDAQCFVDWLVSPEGQQAIADYRIGGQQVFFPNAGAPGA
jgi:tungstate transport system substrate-binding protein